MVSKMFDVQKELSKLSEKYFREQNYICILYGSSVDKINKSDLDICFIVDYYDEKILNDLSIDIVNLHNKFNLMVDKEVPYSNKLIYNKSEVINLVKNSVFFKTSNKISILKEDDNIFETTEMKGRLLYNILTTRNKILVNKCEEGTLDEYRYEAWKVIINALFKHNECLAIPLKELDSYLVEDGKNKIFYKDFLGYSPSNIDKDELNNFLLRMEKENAIMLSKSGEIIIKEFI